MGVGEVPPIDMSIFDLTDDFVIVKMGQLQPRNLRINYETPSLRRKINHVDEVEGILNSSNCTFQRVGRQDGELATGSTRIC